MSNAFVGPIVYDRRVKFDDPLLNISLAIPPEAVRGVIFDRFFSNVDNLRREVISDVLPGVLLEPTGVDVLVKFDDSRSNRSWDM